MVDFLLDQGADLHATNNEGMNAMDLWIVRMCYETAVFLHQKGLVPQPAEFYEGKLAVPYDVELFIEKVNNEEKIDNYKIFHAKIIREEKEWLAKDLVIDPRETWKVRLN